MAFAIAQQVSGNRGVGGSGVATEDHILAMTNVTSWRLAGAVECDLKQRTA
jgi:hypothetical protein